MTFSTADWVGSETIDDVLERMDQIDKSLPSADGIATFNRMYQHVTELVAESVDSRLFLAGEFLERLDVHFANLYFSAYAASLDGSEIPRAWAPLFQARNKPDTVPIQFALAGMNAHISHDLPLAVVSTCRELVVVPSEGTPQHTDYTTTNELLAEAAETIKEWFMTGSLARIDQLGGRVDDALEMFGLHLARMVAWDSAEMLWNLADNPRLDRIFRSGLSRTVELANRGILL
ncbi:hypothetical protein C6I20_06705 [Aeromicrobium sp. A1-2]|uniref:DUF5995 family protein n=1 Tax=Aeromicrobium sp. A1-2 TaxID=2107713 RepID=UPI000E4741B8|nr:DUF5995 family protein [Aeromicrobium sp. A1-2]AXT84909.1 hypothetical protein C6I20_06705 [Aeromicrobium sp. A1-2]